MWLAQANCKLVNCKLVNFAFMDIANIRQDYTSQTLSEGDVAANPFDQFKVWWDAVMNSDITEPNAFTLATASNDGVPAARIVLLKGFDERGFVFYTNYNSYKGQQLAQNPKACAVFFWKELERQVRITGLVEKVSESESTEYYLSRPAGSRVGAWASPQSTVISNRQWLEETVEKYKRDLGDDPQQKPPYWGGYRIKPVVVEFWQGRRSRLHDRIQYSLGGDGGWVIERLAP